MPFPVRAPERAPAAHLARRRDEFGEADNNQRSFLLEHLDELRRRLVYAVVAVFIGFLVAIWFAPSLVAFVMAPLHARLPAGGTFIYTEPMEGFLLHLRVAALAGLCLAAPMVMSQVWLFIAPALYARDKRWALAFIAMTSVFFVLGAAFSHYVVVPLMWQFFVGFSSDSVTFTPRVEPVFSMYVKLLLAFGLVFQMPTVVLFLAAMGVLTARFMVANFKYAVLIIFIVAAILTPPDVVSQVAMALPLIALYALSIGLAWLVGRKGAGLGPWER